MAAFARAADMDANAKALVKLDDDWSKAAAARDADRVASFYAEDAIAYPTNELAAIGRAPAKKVWAAYFADKTLTIWCQGAAAKDWLAARQAEPLPVGYFHLVFTLPAEIAPIARLRGRPHQHDREIGSDAMNDQGRGAS